MSCIPTTAVPILIELGQSIADGDLSIGHLLTALGPFESINRLHWSEWDAVTTPMSTTDLVALFRGATVAERQLRWSGGSVAAAIWIFREIARRDDALARVEADWALAQSDNPYVPFGTYRPRAGE